MTTDNANLSKTRSATFALQQVSTNLRSHSAKYKYSQTLIFNALEYNKSKRFLPKSVCNALNETSEVRLYNDENKINTQNIASNVEHEMNT